MPVRRAGVVLKPAARRDIQSMLVFTVQRWGSAQRQASRDAIDRALATISTNPEIGRSRLYPIEHHVIFYQIDGANVVVIRVLHGRMSAAMRLVEL